MNRGLLGQPIISDGSVSASRIGAVDVRVGTAVARTKGWGGLSDHAGSTALVTEVGVSAAVNRLCWCPDDDRLYAADAAAPGLVHVIHPTTHRVVARFRAGVGVQGMAWCPTTRRLYLAGSDGSMQAVVPGANRIERQFASGLAACVAVVFSPINDRLYVVGSNGDVKVINPHTRAGVTTVALAETAYDAVLAPFDARVIIGVAGGVRTIRALSNTQGENFVSAAPIHHLAFSAVDDAVYGASRTGLIAKKIAVFGATVEDLLSGDNTTLGAIGIVPTNGGRVIYGHLGAGGIAVSGISNSSLTTPGSTGSERVALSCGVPRALLYCPSNDLVYASGDAGLPRISVLT